VVGIDSNIIPEGALHAHKNHLEEKNPELDEVTEKGIPVVVTDEKGEYTQVAEIEKEEIIFSKALTTKIEEMWHKYEDPETEDKQDLTLQAGKILVDEILKNTDDLTGLMKSVE